jgi:hypothetical protein
MAKLAEVQQLATAFGLTAEIVAWRSWPRRTGADRDAPRFACAILD